MDGKGQRKRRDTKGKEKGKRKSTKRDRGKVGIREEKIKKGNGRIRRARERRYMDKKGKDIETRNINKGERVNLG